MADRQIGYPSIEKPWMKYYDYASTIQIKSETVYAHFINQNPSIDSIALEYFNNKISYRKYIENIENSKRCFQAIGIKKGDVVTLCMPTIPEVFYIFFALNQIGAIANFIDPRTNNEFIRNNLKDTNSRALIYVDAVHDKFEDIKTNSVLKNIYYVTVSQSFPSFLKTLYDLKNRIVYRKIESLSHKRWTGGWKEKSNDDYPIEAVSKEDTAAIVYTSGTTELPKGAILTNKNIIALIIQNKICDYGWEKNDKFLEIMPPFIAYGLVCGIVIPTCIGMHIIIIPKFEQKAFPDLMKKYKPNHIMGVPSMMEDLSKDAKMANADLAYLKTVVVGGDSISIKSEEYINEYLEKHNCKAKIMKGYGMTEMSSSAVFTRNKDCNLPGSVGIPLVGNNVKIIDPDSGEELRYGENGEICLTGPTLIQGYFNNTELTEAVFKIENGERWIHSGDIGYMTEDGILFIEGRSKRLIIRYDGFKVIPGLIEKALCLDDDVNECAVVGMKDVAHARGQLPVAFVVLNRDGNKNDVEKRLTILCQSKLPEYEQPAKIVFIEKLPLTSIGKTNYKELAKMIEDSCP
ncbi:MAG: acyl--CoA ligase [Lachnospiraceae bacterium]|nr:acyl--CoA ligase [Lachnospiraceae bacterium]